MHPSQAARRVSFHRTSPYTILRTPGIRTIGSAASQVAAQATVPVTANFTSAGAAHPCSASETPTALRE
jgi:hypothetical protein